LRRAPSGRPAASVAVGSCRACRGATVGGSAAAVNRGGPMPLPFSAQARYDTRMDPRIVRAQHLLDVDRPQEAAAALTELLAEEPEHPEALALLAFASLEAGAVAEALEQARTAVRVAPDNALPWLALGHAALRAKDRGRALGAAERVIELAPDEA